MRVVDISLLLLNTILHLFQLLFYQIPRYDFLLTLRIDSVATYPIRSFDGSIRKESTSSGESGRTRKDMKLSFTFILINCNIRIILNCAVGARRQKNF